MERGDRKCFIIIIIVVVVFRIIIVFFLFVLLILAAFHQVQLLQILALHLEKLESISILLPDIITFSQNLQVWN